MKAFLKRGVRGLRNWLNDPIEAERQRCPQFAYSSLNVALLQILAMGDPRIRPNYTWGVLHAAHLAKSLGISRISALEFGVAGGKGLVALERASEELRKLLGVEIDVYGFDTGKGLPKPVDFRDLPDLYQENTYAMDQEALNKQIHHAKLFLGLIRDTLPEFLRTNPAPIGFISIDVDLYSSTIDSLKFLDGDSKLLLPRIHCYFDDIMGFSFSKFTGERLAIDEFNAHHQSRKIDLIYGLKYFLPHRLANDMWVESMYLAHIFDHPLAKKDGGLVVLKEEHLPSC